MKAPLSAVLLLMLTGCGAGDQDAPGPRTLRAERLAESPSAASGWLTEAVSYRVPRRVQSLTLFGERLAWGAVEAGADASALPRAVEVLDLRSGELLERPLTDAAAAVTALAGTGDWLITRETAEKPLSECEQRGTGCFAWSLWAEDLREPDGGPIALARGGPAPQEALPIPVADAGQVVWQEAQGPKPVRLHIKSLAGGGERKVPIRALTYDISLSQGAVVWSDVDGGSYALDPEADAPRRVATGPVLHAAAGAGFVSTVKQTKPDSADAAVHLQSLRSGSSAAVVYGRRGHLPLATRRSGCRPGRGLPGSPPRPSSPGSSQGNPGLGGTGSAGTDKRGCWPGRLCDVITSWRHPADGARGSTQNYRLSSEAPLHSHASHDRLPPTVQARAERLQLRRSP